MRSWLSRRSSWPWSSSCADRLPRRRKKSSASGQRSRRSRGERAGVGARLDSGESRAVQPQPFLWRAGQSDPFHTFCITSEVGLVPSGPARKLGSPEADCQPVCEGESRAPRPVCPRTAASSTAAARPRSTRRTVRARARTRTSCSSSCRICSGRTRSWRCACAGLPPLGVWGVRIVLIGLAPRLTWACGPGLRSLSPAGAGTQQRTPPRTPHPGLLAPEPCGGPGDRPRTAARSAPQFTDRVSAEQENNPGKEGAPRVHRGTVAQPDRFRGLDPSLTGHCVCPCRSRTTTWTRPFTRSARPSSCCGCSFACSSCSARAPSPCRNPSRAPGSRPRPPRSRRGRRRAGSGRRRPSES